MNYILQNLIRNKKGVTLIEIMTALLILAFAFLPIIAVIGTSTKDTDVANSTVFAQTTARNILDTLLDDVPFNCISADENHIITFKEYNNYDIDSFKTMIGGDGDQGQIIDERGIPYKITIYVWPIFANDSEENKTDTELLFSYLPRPPYEGKTYEENEKWYTYSDDKDCEFMKADAKNPYDLSIFTPEDVATQTYNAYKLGAKKSVTTNDYCVMKKILLRMEWQSRGRIASSCLELYTMKANLDSDGKSIGSES